MLFNYKKKNIKMKFLLGSKDTTIRIWDIKGKC